MNDPHIPNARWTLLAPRDLPTVDTWPDLAHAIVHTPRTLILVNDATRALPRGQVERVRHLLDLQPQAQLLVATGTHRDAPERYRDLYGPRAEVHDARAPHTRLGPDAWDRRALDAEQVLAFGVVEPHYFAGWGGAHKTATVGVWDVASTTAHHRHACDPRAQPLALEGNPVHDHLARALDRFTRDRALHTVNAVVTGDGRPLALHAGPWDATLHACAEVAAARFVCPLPEPADLLIAQVTGLLGQSLYQADKGLKNHEHVVRSGGLLLLCADLDHGTGPDRFLHRLRDPSDTPYVLGDHKALRWRALQDRGVTVGLVTPRADLPSIPGVAVYPRLSDALAAVAPSLPPAPHVVHVQEAGLTVSRRVDAPPWASSSGSAGTAL